MRKYHQLILLVTSVISVSLLLIYRHEYNRLRYVLEVFNFFGQPADCTFSDILNSTHLPQHDWGPVPIWTTEEDVLIYSVFLKNENDVEALIIHEETKVIKFCYLWLDNSNKPIIGNIKYSKLHKLNDNNLALYKYYCHCNSVPEIPYAASFSTKKSKNLMKIQLNPLPKRSYDLTTVCVVPRDIYSKQQIVEFLSFHKILGFESFIIYDNNIPYKFMRTLQKLSMKLNIELVNYPWNFPYANLNIRSIIEEDCLLRTKDKSRNVIVLNWNEFIVPRHHETISTMVDSYDPENKTNRFALKTLKFCIEDNDRREPSILHSLKYDAKYNSEELFFYRRKSAQDDILINTQQISVSVAAIHRYDLCDTLINSKTESVMLKFSNAMRKSILYKLFKYDRL